MNATVDNDNGFLAAALPVFFNEAAEQLDALEQLLLQLEDEAGNRQLLDALFRSAHTIKGSAGLFGFDAVVAFTHHVETALDLLREGKLQLSATFSTLLLRCKDEIRSLLDEARVPVGENRQTVGAAERRAELVASLQAMSGGPAAGRTAQAPDTSAGIIAAAAPATTHARLWRIELSFGVDTFRDGFEPQALLNYLGSMGRIIDLQCTSDRLPDFAALDPESCYLSFGFDFDSQADLPAIQQAFSFVRDDCKISIQPAVAVDAPEKNLPAPAEVAAARPSAPAAAEEPRFIRVQADRLDAVINLLGELVTASAGAKLLARQTRQSDLMAANGQISQLVEEIRNGTLQLRMVPIGETFSRFRRIVRDTAAELGKEVALEIIGGDTELDKSVVERITDPLMHLVRNGLDHGLETPAERLSANKPAQGRLTLSARHEAGSILINIQDDGRGIKRQKVLQRAWERGLVEPGVQPSDADILQLIFAPGFSTAEAVTNLSGRGVGMDVVRSNIEALRGSVQIASNEGQGSNIEIRLPLTLAIIDGFLVGVGNSKFIFPLDAVVEVIEDRATLNNPAGVSRAADAHGRSVVELRGQVLPVVSLRALYALDSAPPERVSVLVLQSGGRRYGVQVDTLLGQHQTVIKPLGRMFRSLRGMSGSSILGNGEVALIFDVNSLCQLACTPPKAGAAQRVPPSLVQH